MKTIWDKVKLWPLVAVPPSGQLVKLHFKFLSLLLYATFHGTFTIIEVKDDKYLCHCHQYFTDNAHIETISMSAFK